jgi:glutathione S-transferase
MYLDWHHSYMRPPVSKYVQAAAKKQENEKLGAAAKTAVKQLQEIWLKDGKFIGGLDEPSIADIFAFGEIIELVLVPPGYKSVADLDIIASFDAVKKWIEKMEKIKYYTEVHKDLFHMRDRVMQKSKL